MVMKHCRECGVKIEEDVTNCPDCGKKNMTPATFSFWCFLSMIGGVVSGATLMLAVLRLHALQ